MKNIIFVCVHNAARSQMAEAFFNQLAEGKAIASSAGTRPISEINPNVVKVMSEIGIDLSEEKPKLLTLKMLEKADRVVTMGCGMEDSCPASLVPTEDWVIDDPEGKTLGQVRKIRDEIKTRIENLIREL